MNGILKDPKPMLMLTGEGSVEYTPRTELELLCIEARNAAFRDGVKPCTVDDILTALAEERAGNDGLGKLWSSSKVTSTQA